MILRTSGNVRLALFLAEWLCFAALVPAQTNIRPNLLLISIDTLRADRLGCYGNKKIRTPKIDNLAAESVRFRTAVSQVPLTLPSHCTILTGTYPSFHGVRDNVGFRLSDSKTTLAEILKAQGYQTAAVVGAYVLNSTFGLNQGFDYYDDKISNPSRSGPVINLNSVERPASEVIAHATNWLRSHSSSRSPFFMFVHLYDPHDPYDPPGTFKEQYGDSPYDGEIAYVDHEVGKLLEFLKQKSLFENTIVVLTSDHGESFGEHQEWTHGFFIYDTTLLVPLIIKPVEKGLSGRVVTEQVSLVDIVPTVLQLLAVRGPTELQGQNLSGLMRGQRRKGTGLAYAETYYPAQFGWSPLVGLRREDYKFIRAPQSELYNLQLDPGEQNNQIAQQTALANDLKSDLGKLESSYSDPNAAQKSQLNMSRKQLDALRSLGYVGASTSSNSIAGSFSGRADPKDKLAAFQWISAGSQYVAAGQYRKAIPVLEKLLQVEREMRVAWSMLGRCHFELGQYDPAKKAFQEILRQQPHNLDAQFHISACDYRQKNWAAAETGLKKVLDQDPKFAAAHLYLGFLFQAKGDAEKALFFFQQVLNLDPENEDAHAKAGFILASRGNVKEALSHFQKVVQLNPNDAEAHSNLSVAYLKTNQPEMSRKERAEACRLDKRYCQQGSGKKAAEK